MDPLEELIAVLRRGSDDARQAAVEQLLARAEALPTLRQLLDDPDADLRWWVVRSLGMIRDTDVPGLLARALRDPDLAVRQCAALGLAQGSNPEAIPDLLAALDGDDSLLARLAGNALISAGGPAVPGLLETLQGGSPRARVEAARALAEIGDRRAIGPFFKAIQDGDSAMVEYWADVGLERMGVGMSFFDPK